MALAFNIPLIVSVLNYVGTGFIDSISLHKTVPLLYESEAVRRVVVSVVSANLISFVGFGLIYSKGIAPLVAHICGNSIATERITSIIYHSNWFVPVCVLCYVSSVIWYQDLADLIFRHLKHIPKETKLTKSISTGTYATVLWLMCFIQMQLLVNFVPLVFNSIADALRGYTALWLLFNLLSVVSQYAGLFLGSLLYGWYGFDPYWISNDVNPDERLSIIEANWAYFLGFGLPYVLIFKLFSFAVGYGIYMADFPFCIILGCLCDYTASYELIPAVGDKAEALVPAIKIFDAAKQWTLTALKFVDERSRLKKGGKKKSE